MKRLIICVCVFLVAFNLACKKEPPPGSALETPTLVGSKIDTEKLTAQTGISFRVQKTETHGYLPLHKFYWIVLEKRLKEQKLEDLADAIIKETIVLKPKTFHSFTIHFLAEEDVTKTGEKPDCFARAYFLPEGSWLRVGRVPIDDYKDYTLTVTLLE